MHGGGYHRAEIRLLNLSALSSDAIIAADQSLSGAGTQTNYYPGTNHSDFGIEPWTAGSYLLSIRLFVNPPFATLSRIEMLDHISDIDLVACYAGGHKGFIEQLSGRPDERMAIEVFLIAGLLSHEHELGFHVPFAENGLGSPAPDVAGPAGFRGVCERLN